MPYKNKEDKQKYNQIYNKKIYTNFKSNINKKTKEQSSQTVGLEVLINAENFINWKIKINKVNQIFLEKYEEYFIYKEWKKYFTDNVLLVIRQMKKRYMFNKKTKTKRRILRT